MSISIVNTLFLREFGFLGIMMPREHKVSVSARDEVVWLGKFIKDYYGKFFVRKLKELVVDRDRCGRDELRLENRLRCCVIEAFSLRHCSFLRIWHVRLL
jgi:hypothetical protein